jgi:hypothetical protein
MIAGKLLAQAILNVNGTYPPPGVSGELRDTAIRQPTNRDFLMQHGTTSDEVDTIVCQDRIIGAGASATYDLYTGTDLLDLNSGTAAFRIIRYAGVFIIEGGDSLGVRVGGAASNEWIGFFVAAGDKQDIFPNALPWQGSSPAGKAVGSATKNLKIENLGAVSVTVRIAIGGTIQVAGGFTGLFSGYLTYP